MSAVASLPALLRETYFKEQPAAAAESLQVLPDRLLKETLEHLSATVLLGPLNMLSTGRALTVFRNLSPEQRGGVLELAAPRLALLMIGGLGEDEREVQLAALPSAIREDLERLQSFGENTAGRLMDRPFDDIRDGMTVAQALDRIRVSNVRRARSVYVVDNENRLVGKVNMQDLALARPAQRLRGLTGELQGSVPASADREEIVELLDRFRVDSLPVVDVEGRLMGVVRYQRLFEAIESVAMADLQKMVGASADERVLSSAMFSVRRRLPWLHINLLTAFLAAAVVGLFENLIAQFTALAVLLPVVAGQSGNAGSQALAVTIRGLALKEIGTREWRRVLSKEVQVGVVDGLVLAVTCGLGVFVWSQSFGLALVIAVAMVLSMVAAGISGALVPIVLTRVGQDPATASSIILTTVTDVAGFFSFLGTATLLSFML